MTTGLRGALRRYGRHDTGCEYNLGYGIGNDGEPVPPFRLPCSCGFAQAIATHPAEADPHPEDFCQRCKRPNATTWHAPSPLWNAVMRDPVTLHDAWSIVCPTCFMELADEKGLGGAWHFGPHEDVSALWKDPDGRVWDGASCLWVKPPKEHIDGCDDGCPGCGRCLCHHPEAGDDALRELRYGLRSLAEYHLDRRNPPPGHAGHREPELPASEWRAAYFVLARIAQEQLDACRALLPDVAGPANVAEIFAHHDAMGCCDPKTTEHLWQSVQPVVTGLQDALRDARLTILAHHFERAYDLRTRPSVVRTQVREIDRLLGDPPTDFDRAQETI